jgi:hypothetical protein
MRVAIFVAIVAAHLIMLLLFPSMRRLVAHGKDEEPAYLPILLPPPAPEWVPQQPRLRPHRTTASPADSSASSRAAPAEQQSSPGQQTQPEVDLQRQSALQSLPGNPDWRAQAEDSAQITAQHIVEAEDTAKRQANALTAHLKPLAPPRARGPQFGWDYAATHRLVPLERGGFAISVNDHCQLLVLPMPFFGCSIGKIEANGDLFEFMHPPVKFGDWDKRDADP